MIYVLPRLRRLPAGLRGGRLLHADLGRHVGQYIRGRTVIIHSYVLSYRDSPYKREVERDNDRRPSSKQVKILTDFGELGTLSGQVTRPAARTPVLGV